MSDLWCVLACETARNGDSGSSSSVQHYPISSARALFFSWQSLRPEKQALIDARHRGGALDRSHSIQFHSILLSLQWHSIVIGMTSTAAAAAAPTHRSALCYVSPRARADDSVHHCSRVAAVAAVGESTGAPGVAERVLTSTSTSTAHSSSEKEMTSISGNEGGGNT